MSDYYTPSSWPVTRSSAASSPGRAETASIQAGFDKVAAYTGNANKVVVINSTGTAQTSLSEAAFKALVNLESGVDVQAYSAILAAFAAGTYAFGNVTIQTNALITTNTDGRLLIRANGAGGVDLGGVSTAALSLSNANNLLNVGIGDITTTQHLALGGSRIQSKTNATTAGVLGLNVFGGQTEIGAQSGTGDVLIYSDAALRLRASTNGIDISNLRLSGNGVVSTNANGRIAVRADGSGGLDLGGNSAAAVSLSNALNLVNISNGSPVTEDHLALGANVVQAKDDATTARALSLNPLGGDLNLGAQSGGGSTFMYANGAVRLFASSLGIDINNLRITGNQILSTNAGGSILVSPDTGGTLVLGNSLDVSLVDFGASITVGSTVPGANPHLGFGPSKIQAKANGMTAAALSVNPLGGNVLLGGSVSSQSVILQPGASGFADVKHEGNLVLRSHATGVSVIGGTGNDPSLLFYQDDGTTQNADLSTLSTLPSNVGLRLRNWIHGGHVLISSENSGGTETSLFIGDPATHVQLRNSTTGTGMERALTSSDVGQLKIKASNTSRSLTDVSADDPEIAGFQCIAGIRYEFSGTLLVSSSSAVPDFRFDLNSTTSPTSFFVSGWSGSESSTDPLIPFHKATISGDNIITNVLAGVVSVIHFQGYAEFPTTATVNLQWAQRFSDATNTTLNAGSFVRLLPTRS